MTPWIRAGICALIGGMVFSILLESWELWGFLSGAGAGALFAASSHFVGGHGSVFLRPAKIFPYLWSLVKQMILSSIGLIRLILRGGEMKVSILREIPSVGERGRVLVANSVTLTPGSVTLEETKEDYIFLLASEAARTEGPVAARFDRHLQKEAKV